MEDGEVRLRSGCCTRTRKLARAGMPEGSIWRYGGDTEVTACWQRVGTVLFPWVSLRYPLCIPWVSLRYPLYACGDFSSPTESPPSPTASFGPQWFARYSNKSPFSQES